MDETQIHVALTGDDTWPGTAGQPLKSLAEARRKARELRAAGLRCPITILVHEGLWHLDETFLLTVEDSGLRDAPTTYAAAPGEHVTLSGGRRLTGFRPYKGKILQCDVSGLDLRPITDTTSPIRPFELFCNGKRQDLARWPNHDPDAPFDGEWAYIKGAPEEPTHERFIFAGDRPMRWAKPEKAQVHLFPRWDWADCFVGVKGVDAERSVIELADRTSYDIVGGRRYYVRNVFEELDAPGEWYHDDETGTLYFWPPCPPEMAEATVSVLDDVIALRGASHIVLRGFTIEHARASSVTMEDCSSCSAQACTIRNAGGFGARVTGGKGNSFVGCDVTETGRGGVELSGGDRKTLTPGGNRVENCHIHHYARLKKCYATGVNISGVGNTISHCLIHDAPHTAILLHGNEHVIEYTEIHDVVQEVQDAGAFYLGRDWSERGNVLRYNCFHDLYGYGLDSYDAETGIARYESPRGINAVYMDDNASGLHVYGNVFYRCSLIGIMIGGGKDNIIENNVIVESYPAFHLDARWDQFFAPDSEGGVRDYMRRKLEDVSFDKPPYSERYPTLPGVVENPRLPTRNRFVRNVIAYTLDDVGGVWNMREGEAVVYHLPDFEPGENVIDSNLVWHGGAPVRVRMKPYLRGESKTLTWEEWKQLGHDGESAVDDPLFVAPEEDDYRLREDSPAFALGFEQIPMNEIGLYESELRASWPVDARRRAGDVRHRIYEYSVERPEEA